MTRRNWLKALAAALCGIAAPTGKAARESAVPATELGGCTLTFTGMVCGCSATRLYTATIPRRVETRTLTPEAP
jgi:hypothetical protein